MRLRAVRAKAALALFLASGMGLPAWAQSADTPAVRPVPRPSADVAALAGPGSASATAPGSVPGAAAADAGVAALRMAPAAVGSSPDPLAQAVLTVDQEAMYRQSAWGQRAERQIAQQSRQVAADNDTAFAALVADEDALTAARATLGADEFRKRAVAFDERVTAVRKERDAARAAVAQTAELDRALFFQAAAPVMTRVMKARGARVVLDQRTVLISDQEIDVTAATIAALDRALGDGAAIVAAAARDGAANPSTAAGDVPVPAQSGALGQRGVGQDGAGQDGAGQDAAVPDAAGQDAAVQGGAVQGGAMQDAAGQGAAGQPAAAAAPAGGAGDPGMSAGVSDAAAPASPARSPDQALGPDAAAPAQGPALSPAGEAGR